MMENSFQDILQKLSQYKDENKFDKISVLANELIHKAKEEKDIYAEGMGYYYLAETKYFDQEYVECLQLCWNIHFVCERQVVPRLSALSYNLAGKVNCNQGDYHTAVSLFLKGYYISKEHAYLDLEACILNNIGTLFFNLEHYEEAIRYYERALVIIKKSEVFIKKFLEIVMINIVSGYLRLRKFDEVERWTDQFIKAFPNSNNYIVKTGLIMRNVLESYEFKNMDKFQTSVLELIEITKKYWTGNYAIKVLIETSEFCLNLQEYDILKACLECLKERLVDEDFRHRIQLSYLYIEMYRSLNEKEKLYKELEEYYQLTRQSHTQDKSIEFNGLKNKIILEREVFAKNKLIEKNEELSAKAKKDQFTGLLNKTSFIEHTNRKLQTKLIDGYHTLFIVDIDNFKYINDTYGHLIGDEVIKLLANSFVNTFRLGDFIGRIGGDEFCIYVQGIKSMKTIEEKSEALRKEIQNLYVPSCVDCKVTASIGVCATRKNLTYQELFAKADEALYESKNMGKNRFYIKEDL